MSPINCLVQLPEPHAHIRLHSKLLLSIYNAQQQASRLRRAIFNDSMTLLRNPRSQSDIRNRDRLSNCHLSALHGHVRATLGAICLLERRINFHLAISASLAACANALTSLSAFLSTTNVATASLKACRNPAGAAAPWTQLGRSLSLAKEFIDQL